MKRLTSWLILYATVLTLLGIFFAAKRYLFQQYLPTIPVQANGWQATEEIYESLAVDSGTLIFAGDSRMAYSPFPEWFPGSVGRGIEGETLPFFLKRLPSLLKTYPRGLVVCIGINDIWQKRQDIEQNFDSLIKTCHVPLLLMEVMPVATFYPNAPSINQTADSINRFLRMRQRQFHFNLIHVFDTPLANSVTWDGIHFNARGYARWHNALGIYLQSKYMYLKVSN